MSIILVCPCRKIEDRARKIKKLVGQLGLKIQYTCTHKVGFLIAPRCWVEFWGKQQEGGNRMLTQYIFTCCSVDMPWQQANTVTLGEQVIFVWLAGALSVTRKGQRWRGTLQ